MNEKELQEIEQGLRSKIQEEWPTWEQIEQLIAEVSRLKERNAQITQNYNKRVEKYYYLQQEVRRLKDELESWQGLAHDRLKVALEENIPIIKNVLQVIKNQVDYDEGITLGGVIVQLEKALEVDTNESK